MTKKLTKVFLDLALSLAFIAFMIFYMLPKFQQRVMSEAQKMFNLNSQNYQKTINSRKSVEQARLNEVTKPVYVDKPHQGYTIRKAEIRTCAMAQCTVVGYLPKDTMVKWHKVENGFVNYDSAYYVKLVGMKKLFLGLTHFKGFRSSCYCLSNHG